VAKYDRCESECYNVDRYGERGHRRSVMGRVIIEFRRLRADGLTGIWMTRDRGRRRCVYGACKMRTDAGLLNAAAEAASRCELLMRQGATCLHVCVMVVVIRSASLTARRNYVQQSSSLRRA